MGRILKVGLICLIVAAILTEASSESEQTCTQDKHCEDNDIACKEERESCSGSGSHYKEEMQDKGGDVHTTTNKNVMNLAVVACLDRVEETLVMLKSALMQTSRPLHFIIFADNTNMPKFEAALSTWEGIKDGSATYKVHPIQLPEEKTDKWRTLWRPCASQRLFLPKVLPTTDAVLYVDTDVLFLKPLEQIWRLFRSFNSTQLAGVAPEHESSSRGAGWYNRFARHPYYGEMGVNSGVMLMNLTRMREVNWVDKMVEYYAEYNLVITWGDQDLINIFFHFYPEKVYIFPCEWNFRPDHCMYGIACHSAEENGAYVLHGNREVFHNEKQPAFKAVYDAFSQSWELSEVAKSAKIAFENSSVSSMPCGKVKRVFMRQLQIRSKKKKDVPR